MEKQMTDAEVDAVEQNLRTVEAHLEHIGQSVCPAKGGGETWYDINRAIDRVSEAIHSAWRMRPILAAVALFALAGTSLGQTASVDRGALMDAIAMVESDRGATSRNVYQIRRIYWTDVNRIMRWRWNADSFADIVYFKPLAEEYINAYWDYYAARYTRLTGKTATAEVLARIHNGGPDGWRKAATKSYWRRVRKYYKPNNNRKGN